MKRFDISWPMTSPNDAAKRTGKESEEIGEGVEERKILLYKMR